MEEPEQHFPTDRLFYMAINFHKNFVTWQSRKAAEDICRNFGFHSAVEIGCGLGLLSDELKRMRPDADIVLSDLESYRAEVVRVDAHALPELWTDEFDLVICSNCLEHFRQPADALKEMRRVGRWLWLSWTPWWSPFGGHDFSPLHYLGWRKGRHHELGRNLFRITVSEALSMLEEAGWVVNDIRPRYYPWLPFLARWRWTREWATWNVQVHAF